MKQGAPEEALFLINAERSTRRECCDMSEPITTMDPRYSDPDAVATDWEKTCRTLEAAEVFWLSTMRADGSLHVTPVVAIWIDETMHFCTGDTQQKAINLRIVVRDRCFSHVDEQDVVLVFSVTPARVYAFTRGQHGGHTRHQF